MNILTSIIPRVRVDACNLNILQTEDILACLHSWHLSVSGALITLIRAHWLDICSEISTVKEEEEEEGEGFEFTRCHLIKVLKLKYFASGLHPFSALFSSFFFPEFE